jgi:DNA-binding beta-propeller fold protein YncE
MNMKIRFLVAIAFIAVSARAQSGFELIKKTVIGGEGGWDYLSVDSENRRLYISHGSQVEVLDADTHAKVGTITNLKGVHGIVAVPKSGRGIITNGRTNSVTIFDLKTLQPIAELPTGKNPDALLYDPYSDRVFIFNHSGGSVTAVDITAGKVTGTLEVKGEGLEAGASDEKGTIFVNIEDNHEIVSFDAKTLTIKNRWKLTPGEEPTGIAIDRVNHRLFAACHNSLMMVVDSDNGKIVAQVPIGTRVDGAIFDPVSRVAISSNGEGSMTVVQEVSATEFKAIETVKTQPGARTIAYDSKTHHVFLCTANYGETPAATAENPNPRPKIVPGTFVVLEYGKK